MTPRSSIAFALRQKPLAALICMTLATIGCGSDPTPPAADGGGDTGARLDARAACTATPDCDDGRFCNGAEVCDPTSTAADDRGCAPGAAPCAAVGCDESTDMCTGPCATSDADGDGASAVACGGDDCDDADAARFPGNPEVCDAAGHDEDCNPTTVGGLDADGDGLIDTACCNDRDGTPFCGTDCDDSAAGVFPGAIEVCNGRDDDCNVLVDDVNPGIVLCASGTSIACATSCGVVGRAPCRADCLGYDTCTADEVCNGCDDDNDGSIDDGFECARGTTDSCTTACDTPGQRICDASCAYASACAATSESCNYCDDNIRDGILDERLLATSNLTNIPISDGLYSGVAASDGIGSSPIEIYARLLDGTATDTAGAFWLDVPRHMGWGAITFDVTVEARVVPPAAPAPDSVPMPLGGWSVVLATGGTGDIGPATNRGVPTTLQGVSFDWFWSTFSFFDPTPYAGDSMRYRSFTDGPRGTYSSDSDGDDIFPGADLDANTSFINQRMLITYLPDDPSTPLPVNEERVDFSANGTLRTFVPVPPMPTSVRGPRNDIPVGSTLRIGFTAGTFSRVLTPRGAPSAYTFGVPVEARIHVETISFGSMGAVFHTYYNRLSEETVCPGSM